MWHWNNGKPCRVYDSRGNGTAPKITSGSTVVVSIPSSGPCAVPAGTKAVLVNVVAPGPTDTALLAEVMVGERGAKILEGMRRTIPLGRLGQPEDVAGAVAYFASDEAAYVTGQVLSVSGGLTMAG